MIKVLQINLNRAHAAHADLERRVNREDINVCIISEANRNKSKSKADRDQGWISDDTGDTAIWLPAGTKVTSSSSIRGITTAKLAEEDILIISCYFSPSRGMDEFEDYLSQIDSVLQSSGGRTLIAGDFNAASRLWGSDANCSRGREIEDMAARGNLHIINDGNRPSVCRPQGTSFVDLTMTTNPSDIIGWTVRDEAVPGSDHLYIEFQIKARTTNRHAAPRTVWKAKNLKQEVLIEILDKECKKLNQQRALIDETSVSSILRKACEEACTTLPRHIRGKPPCYWWTPEVADLRRETNIARRHYVRARRVAADDAVYMEPYKKDYFGKKKKYANAIMAAKREGWTELIRKLRDDVWGMPYKIVRGKLGSKRLKLPSEKIDRAITQLFPEGHPFPREPVQVDENEVPKVTVMEVIAAADRMAPHKAAGPDGVPPEVTKKMMKRWPGIFAKMTSAILAKGVFPSMWKTATLVLIPKPKKPDAYRPICLLDTIAKGVETIINNRLQEELEEDRLSERQFGFRRGRSTLTALDTVYNMVAEERKRPWQRRNRCLMVLLDVQNAFNSIEWEVILDSLRTKGISPYLRRILSSYLQDRYIIDEEGRKHTMSAGVPQGSVLGPTLWNSGYDGVLDINLPQGAKTIAYADDLALLVTGRTMEALEATAQEALDAIEYWMRRNRLKLAPEKTEAVMLVKRRKERTPKVNLAGHAIAISKTVKYLGVTLQAELTGVEHVRQATLKAAKAATDIAKILPRTYGASEAQRRVLSTVSQSIALYGAPVWAPRALTLKKNIEALDRAQRTAGIRISRCYRTVSTEAIMVIAGVAPWSLSADERTFIHRLHQRQEAPYASETDDEDDEQTEEEIKDETITRWQHRWDQADKGRWTHQCIPSIKSWIDRKHGEVTYFTAQMLTGHGCFRRFLHRIGKAAEPTCSLCALDEEDDPHHTFIVCPTFAMQRRTILAVDVPDMVRQMLSSENEWERISRLVACILKKKEALIKAHAAQQASATGTVTNNDD